MRTSDKGLAALAAEEGMVLGRYIDSEGNPTWGIGITENGYAGFDDLPENPSHAQVIKQFKNDVRKYENAVNAAIDAPVTQNQFDALVSFHYNTGGIHRAALTKKLNAGDIAGAAKSFMGWSKPKSIIPRRKREQAMFRDGVYSERAIAVYSGGSRKKIGTMSQAEFISKLAKPIYPPDLPDPVPENIGTPITRSPASKGLGLGAGAAIGLTAVVAALGVWWDNLVAFIGGIFG